MKLAERAPLRQVADQVRGWVETPEPLHDARDHVTLTTGDTAARFTGRAVTVELPEGLTIRALPLTAGDAELLTATARGTALPAISEGLSRAIELLSVQDGDLIAAMRTVTKVRRLFTGAATRTAGRQASRTITELHADLFAADVPSRLSEASGALDRLPTAVAGPIAALTAQAERVAQAAARRRSAAAGTVPDDPWSDFLGDPARYLALLAELGVLGDDGEAARGDLPEQIVEAVRAFRLDTSLLRATLRGYQDFAARFALVQRKTVIGDEMGLGKTVEALAVATHLSAGAHGAHHLVVCPAAVVTNWMRETDKHTRLPAHRLHGVGREEAGAQWLGTGGVAVTTFETLAWFEREYPTLPELSLVIVDEAHYIKNPDAQRSQRSATLIAAASYAVLLTGTPMENRIDEFATLIGYLQPDLVVGASEIAPARFRRQVAPAYLRRNQEDVLTELPELIEIDELLPLSGADLAAYTAAVRGGGFAQMRQAAMLQGEESAKIARLREIAAEAAANGQKILVFSFFLSVLDAAARAVPGPVFGPLTGAVPAAARQELVDEFSAAGPGAVLIAQITAGGVGLNIQAASVMVLCEPQLKPTAEWQAIARARRMGQLEAVQVHRLLSEDGVDQRLLELLAHKSALFDDFARISATAGSAEEAYDISETALARQVIAAERARLEVTEPA